MSVFKINKSPDEERRDKGIRQKLNNHSVTPPSYIWDNVEENLPQKNKRRPFIFWLLPMAACLAGLAGLLYILMPKNTSEMARLTTESGHEHTISQAENTPAHVNGNFGTSQAENTDAAMASTQNAKIENKKSQENIVSAQKSNNIEKQNLHLPGNKTFTNSVNSTSHSRIGNQTAKSHTGNNTEAGKDEETIVPTETGTTQNGNIANAEDIDKHDSILLAETKPDENTATAANQNTVKKSSKTNNTKGKWALGGDIGAGTSYRFLSKPAFFKQDAMIPANANPTDYNKIESAGFSFTAGFKTKYDFNDNWSIISGLSYTKASIQSKSNTIVYIDNSTNEPGDTSYIQKNSTGEFDYVQLEMFETERERSAINSVYDPSEASFLRQANIKYTFSYLDVPLHVQYKTSAKKAAWFIQGGPTMRFLTGKKAFYSMDDYHASVQLSQPYNKFAISASLASGISIPVNNFDVQLGPSINVWLTPLMQSQPKTHLYTAHVNGTVFYNF